MNKPRMTPAIQICTRAQAPTRSAVVAAGMGTTLAAALLVLAGMAVPQTVLDFEVRHLRHVLLVLHAVQNLQPMRHRLTVGFFNRREIRCGALNFAGACHVMSPEVRWPCSSWKASGAQGQRLCDENEGDRHQPKRLTPCFKTSNRQRTCRHAASLQTYPARQSGQSVCSPLRRVPPAGR